MQDGRWTSWIRSRTIYQKHKRDKALRKVMEDKPFMLIVSSMCGPYSALQSVFN